MSMTSPLLLLKLIVHAAPTGGRIQLFRSLLNKWIAGVVLQWKLVVAVAKFADLTVLMKLFTGTGILLLVNSVF